MVMTSYFLLPLPPLLPAPDFPLAILNYYYKEAISLNLD